MEIFVEIQENVRGEDVFIIQSTSFPANDHLMELLIIIDALRRSSARRITAVIPYFGYARQDRKPAARTPISAKLVANLITHAGADRVLTLDLHAGQIQGFFDIPTDNLFARPVMARDIKEQLDGGNRMVVSPDVGGVVRARALAKRIDAPLAIVDKRRERPGESEVMNIIGDVSGRSCILVDDIVDSGGTLVNAADALLANGAKEVYAYITHGVLSGGAVARIAGSKLKELVITDFDHADRGREGGPQHPRHLDRPAHRRGHRPHGDGKLGVEPVRLRAAFRRFAEMLYASCRERMISHGVGTALHSQTASSWSRWPSFSSHSGKLGMTVLACRSSTTCVLSKRRARSSTVRFRVRMNLDHEIEPAEIGRHRIEQIEFRTLAIHDEQPSRLAS